MRLWKVKDGEAYFGSGFSQPVNHLPVQEYTRLPEKL